MKVLFRIAVVLGFAFLGLVAGTYLGGRYLVPEGSGLAAAPMALGYGLLGALVFAGIGLALGLKLSGRGLTVAAVCVCGIGLILFGLLVFLFFKAQAAEQDPDSAYHGLPAYTVRLEQTVITDPYLATAFEVDTKRRRWTTRLPDGRTCRGNLGAKTQERIGNALMALSSLEKDAFRPCRATADRAEQLLVWEIPDAESPGSSGRLDISPVCLVEIPALAETVNAVRRVNLSSRGKVTCD